MAIEIELKARLSSPEPVKKRLASLGLYLHHYEKIDTYWIPQVSAANPSRPARAGTGKLPATGVRVRRERIESAAGIDSAALVTYKIKELTDGIEVNDEREFTVSSNQESAADGGAAAVFEDLLERLGLKPGIRKEKRGWAWRIPTDLLCKSAEVLSGPPVLAELSEVAGLGWFIELESLAAERSEKTVARCRERLLALLEKLGIGADHIEERPYSQMLAAC
jgi:adenylate cyclase class 2